ncbi:39S ribosomal protein L12, mitochondrial [Protopterus annectens]|uniref:39S ribosomal protein L12, mitochondrial n=1 Tax=Protopterus annectens TaxID=7888 RepID=UPI001CFC0BE7|nr:39S ribosomal protein L12, mitochondrial [Protopterus annectens]
MREHLYDIGRELETNALARHVKAHGDAHKFVFMVIDRVLGGLRGGDLKLKVETKELEWIAAEEEAAPIKKEKTSFTVKLTEIKAEDKVKLIKEVKNFIPGINLVQAKKLVESLPQEIKANVSKDEAEKVKAALEAAGGTVALE